MLSHIGSASLIYIRMLTYTSAQLILLSIRIIHVKVDSPPHLKKNLEKLFEKFSQPLEGIDQYVSEGQNTCPNKQTKIRTTISYK